MIYIYIGGMTQCGSTRLFNFIIKCYEKSSLNVDSCWCKNLYENDYNHNADVLIVKFHDFPQKNFVDMVTHVLLPIRDPRDCVISTNKRFFPNDPKNVGNDIKKIVKNIGLFEEWKMNINPNKIFVSKYENFDLSQMINITKFLNLKISEETIAQIDNELDDMHNSKDIVKTDNKNDTVFSKTLLSQNHNTSGGKSNKYIKYYDQNEKKRILVNGKIRNFLKKYCYDTS